MKKYVIIIAGLMVGLKFNEKNINNFVELKKRNLILCCIILFTTGNEEGNKQKVESCPRNQI